MVIIIIIIIIIISALFGDNHNSLSALENSVKDYCISYRKIYHHAA